MKRGLEAHWGERGWVCVCACLWEFFWCPKIPSLVSVRVRLSDPEIAGPAVRSFGVFLGNRGNKEWKFLVNTFQLQFLRFWFSFKTICASHKYLWIQMTWSSSTMFISFFGNLSRNTVRNKLLLGTPYSVKGQGSSLSYMCAQQQTSHHHRCAQGSLHRSDCEIHNTDGLDWDQGETASH